MGRKLTLEEFENKVKERHPNLKILGKYDGSHVKVLTQCTVCGHEWMCQPSNIYALVKGTGCPKCGRERDGLNKANSQEAVLNRFKQINNQYDYSKVEYKNSWTKVCIICTKHGEFWMTPDNIYAGHGCPHCKHSTGEKLVTEILKENKIDFIYQYRIKDLQFSNKFVLIDFYLPNSNTFIEFNGALHYIPIKYFGGEVKFKKQLLRDLQLREYCSKNKINLIEIPYTKTEKEIRIMLNEL